MHKGITVLKTRPLLTVVVISLLLLGLIIAGNYFRRPAMTQTTEKKPITVELLRVGEPFRTTLSTQVEKQGVVTIYAQTNGVVRQVAVSEGKTVKQGSTLIKLASNYQGGSAQTTQRQLAERQAQFDNDTYDLKIETIRKQQAMARESMEYTEEIKTLTQKSLEETKSLLTLNENILGKLERDVLKEVLASSDPNNDDDVYAAKKSQASYQSVVNQLKSQIRANELQIATDKPDYQFAELQRDTTLKQLELQEKAIQLSKDVSALNLQLARISESLMYPAAPWAGTVEKVFVKPGQLVAPGTPLAVIRGKKVTAELTALVGKEVARWASTASGSAQISADMSIPVTPLYVSQEAVDGGLYAIRLTVPDEFIAQISDGDYLPVTLESRLPIQTDSNWWWLPLESVVQLQNKSLVYVVENNTVVGKPVETGAVSGEFVAVKGVTQDMQVIRVAQEVVAGDSVVTSAE